MLKTVTGFTAPTFGALRGFGGLQLSSPYWGQIGDDSNRRASIGMGGPAGVSRWVYESQIKGFWELVNGDDPTNVVMAFGHLSNVREGPGHARIQHGAHLGGGADFGGHLPYVHSFPFLNGGVFCQIFTIESGINIIPLTIAGISADVPAAFITYADIYNSYVGQRAIVTSVSGSNIDGMYVTRQVLGFPNSNACSLNTFAGVGVPHGGSTTYGANAGDNFSGASGSTVTISKAMTTFQTDRIKPGTVVTVAAAGNEGGAGNNNGDYTVIQVLSQTVLIAQKNSGTPANGTDNTFTLTIQIGEMIKFGWAVAYVQGAPPSTGKWAIGDIAIDTSKAPGTPDYWVCTSYGDYASAQIPVWESNKDVISPRALTHGDFPAGGSIGTAAATVDIASLMIVTQNTAAQTITIPSPTTTTAGRYFRIINNGTTGATAQAAAGGGASFAIPAGTWGEFAWDGTTWRPRA